MTKAETKEYYRQYRLKNRKRLNAYQKQWKQNRLTSLAIKKPRKIIANKMNRAIMHLDNALTLLKQLH